MRGLRGYFLGALDVPKTRGAAERERELVRIEHLEHDDVRSPELEVAQPFDDRLWIVQKVRENHHQASLEQGLRQLVERTPDVRSLPGLHLLERKQQRVQVTRPRRRRQPEYDFLVEGDEPG